MNILQSSLLSLAISLGLISSQIDMKAVVKSDLIPAKDGAP